MTHWFRYMKWVALPLAILLPLGAADKGITHEQADEILKELREIKELLTKQGGNPPQQAQGQQQQNTRADVSIDGAYTLGSKDAPLTMVEFTDFQCPFCQRFHLQTFVELKKNYIDTGKLRFVSRDLPLDFHPNAMQAAQAGRCAGEQGQFWAMRDRMNSNPEKLDIASLSQIAQELKLNVANFRGCVESGKYKNSILSDAQTAERIGANGTPSFVLGKSKPTSVEGELIIGAMPYEVFDQKIKALAQ